MAYYKGKKIIFSPKIHLTGDASFFDGSFSGNIANDKITTLRRAVFIECFNLTGASFPNVTTVGNNAFNQCIKLETCNIPLIENVPDHCFNGCNALKRLEFTHLQSIGASAFYNCRQLKTLIISNTDTIPTLVNTNAFNASAIASGTGYIYVHDAILDTMKVDTNWSKYASQIKTLAELPAEAEE